MLAIENVIILQCFLRNQLKEMLVNSPFMTEHSKPNIFARLLGTVSVLKNSVPAILEQLPTASQQNCGK